MTQAPESPTAKPMLHVTAETGLVYFMKEMVPNPYSTKSSISSMQYKGADTLIAATGDGHVSLNLNGK